MGVGWIEVRLEVGYRRTAKSDEQRTRRKDETTETTSWNRRPSLWGRLLSIRKMSENEFIPVGSESVEAEEIDENEEMPVIDVHAPHGGVHTWKDFWIHPGTIAAGLLIAIGLEQTVEKLHHLEQRHQLEEDLHAEGLRDHTAVAGDLPRLTALPN